MQLGLIVLPSNEAELNAALKALSALGVSTTAASIAAPAGKATTAKTKAAPVEVEEEPEAEDLKPVTGPELQAIMTQVRDDKGAEAVTEILTAYGATKLKELDKSDWPAVYAAAQTLLADGDDDLLDDDLGGDDDLLDDDLGGEELDHEAVKVACQEHAKKHGKAKTTAILEKNGLNTVRGLAKADQSVLAAIMKAVS